MEIIRDMVQQGMGKEATHVQHYPIFMHHFIQGFTPVRWSVTWPALPAAEWTPDNQPAAELSPGQPASSKLCRGQTSRGGDY